MRARGTSLLLLALYLTLTSPPPHAAAAVDPIIQLFVASSSSSSTSSSSSSCDAHAPCASLTQPIAVARTLPYTTALQVNVAPGVYYNDCTSAGLLVDIWPSFTLQNWNT